MYDKTYPEKRYNETIKFLTEAIPPPATILDLGVKNPFSEIMKSQGYSVTNTTGQDLDLDTTAVINAEVEVITALEILEHLVSPFPLLRDIKAKKIVASVPLRLWFAPAYRSKTDLRDRHYHEFEKWQFDWLLEKAGWNIKMRHQWTNPVKKLGFRPLLRTVTPRYYIVFAERD